MHSKNIIHRDLKSLNIFMIKESIGKLGDLGCAIELPEELEKEPVKIEETKVADIDGVATALDDIEDNPFDMVGADLCDDEQLFGQDDDMSLLEND